LVALLLPPPNADGIRSGLGILFRSQKQDSWEQPPDDGMRYRFADTVADALSDPRNFVLKFEPGELEVLGKKSGKIARKFRHWRLVKAV